VTYWYMASPYSKYPLGRETAYIDACREVAVLLNAGVHCLSPIAATHGAAIHGDIDPDISNPMWMKLDRAFADAAHGLIVSKLDGWDESVGVATEIGWFRMAGKPVVYMEPGIVPEEFL
jgi:hypothetical protein